MSERFVVIMAGGKGERFWPQSRLRRPKQLLPIVGDDPLLKQTVDRLAGLIPARNIFIITNQEQAEAVMEVCPDVPKEQVIAEPEGRDTAAAVGLATILVRQRSPHAAFAVLPADHVIKDSKAFQSVLKAAFEVAEERDSLITIGIEPEFAATGYGYIHRGVEKANKADHPVFSVRGFVEKPNEAKAKEYVESGEYFWNAGMFIWRADVVAGAFEKHAKELWSGLLKIEEALQAGSDLDDALRQEYPVLKKTSVDYALMEKANNVLTIPSSFDWDDVGAWPALARHLDADADGNHNRGAVVTLDSSGNIIVGQKDHLIAVLGVSNSIIVHTGDATLVCSRERAQDIKKLVQEVSKRFGDGRYI